MTFKFYICGDLIFIIINVWHDVTCQSPCPENRGSQPSSDGDRQKNWREVKIIKLATLGWSSPKEDWEKGRIVSVINGRQLVLTVFHRTLKTVGQTIQEVSRLGG